MATSEQRDDRIYWRLAILKLVNGSLMMGLMAFISGTTAVDWNNLSGFERLIIIGAAYVAVSKYIDAYFDQMASRLLAGKPPIGTNGTGNTEQIKKEVIIGGSEPKGK